MSSQEERLDQLQNRLILGEITEQEYQRLKAVLLEDLKPQAQGVALNDSVVQGDVQAAGGGVNLSGMFAAQLVTCRICGRKNEPKQTFRCRECGRDDLCLEHFDAAAKRCEECSAKARQAGAYPAQPARAGQPQYPPAVPRPQAYVPPPQTYVPPPVPPPQPYQPPVQPNPFGFLGGGNQARAAMMYAVAGMCTFWAVITGFIFGGMAVRCASIAKKQVQAGQLPPTEDSRATTAMALGWVVIVLSLIAMAAYSGSGEFDF